MEEGSDWKRGERLLWPEGSIKELIERPVFEPVESRFEILDL